MAMPRALWRPLGGGRFLVTEVPLCAGANIQPRDRPVQGYLAQKEAYPDRNL